jgi:hypothetical protein
MTKEEIDALLAAEKDAGSLSLTWSPARNSRGNLIAATLNFTVACAGEELIVRAEWKGIENQQIMLKTTPTDTANYARLCLASGHGATPVHWHFYERCKGVREEQHPCSYTPTVGAAAMDELLLHFVREQHIVNFALAGRLFDGS